MILALIVMLSGGWSMRGRWRRGDSADDAYNGGTAADPAVMEAARKNHGRLW
ncbi:MAG TPA: hypothetical protein VGS17_03955 [Candidatus Limnocylindria bacterium]|nr:hypothetical protein [Candidatus Limnocylindria bacterium]